MIRIFIGCPGTCKTVHALGRIVQALEQGRSVYTNIEGLSWFGNDLTSLLGIFPNLHFLHQDQAEQFFRHVEPGSLVVIDEFFHLGIFCQRRSEFFEYWFEDHYFAGTELILIGQQERLFAQFFHHQPNDASSHKAVNPNRLYRFFRVDLFRHRFHGFYVGTVDNSYLFRQSRLEPAIDCRWENRRLLSLPRTLNRIKSFFCVEVGK